MAVKAKRWGVEVLGSDNEKAYWACVLKPPCDPYLEVVEAPRGDYHALVSSQFDKLPRASDVYELAKRFVPLLNTTVRSVHDFDAMMIGAIVDFASEGVPKKQHFMSAQAGAFRFRAFAEVTNMVAQGNVIPTQSTVQRWMQAAETNPEIVSAIRYLDDGAGWFDVYKACEALDSYSHPGISKKRLQLMKRTADSYRHHRSANSKIEPPANPMSFGEAKRLTVLWLNAAIDEVIQD